MKAEVVFADELSYIESDEIRKFVLDVFDRFTPDYFWTVPCSTSGKYHPKISLGNGGLIRHVKYAVWWGIEIMQCWPNLSLDAIGEVTAALILHDLNKNGESLDAKGFATLPNAVSVHGPYLGNKIRLWIGGKVGMPDTAIQFEDPERINRVIAAIEGHMGIWTDSSYEMMKPQYLEPGTDIYNVCNIVHLADYCASRKSDDEMKNLDYNPSDFEVMYAIGQENGNLGLVLWAGPVPAIDTMLAMAGRDEKSVIAALDAINSDKPTHRWDPAKNEWKEIE